MHAQQTHGHLHAAQNVYIPQSPSEKEGKEVIISYHISYHSMNFAYFVFIYSRVYELMQKYPPGQFLQATLNTALVVQK